MDQKGEMHIYTGDGKGKTSAAVGLCVRALGAGLKVLFIQFIKDGSSSELKVLKGLPGFVFKCHGHGRFMKGSPSESDIETAQAGLREAADALKSGEYDLVVMDELNCAISARLLELDDVMKAIEARANGVELVITGRKAEACLIECAGLVSEVKCLKHYFQKGRKALPGIEF